MKCHLQIVTLLQSSIFKMGMLLLCLPIVAGKKCLLDFTKELERRGKAELSEKHLSVDDMEE